MLISVVPSYVFIGAFNFQDDRIECNIGNCAIQQSRRMRQLLMDIYNRLFTNVSVIVSNRIMHKHSCDAWQHFRYDPKEFHEIFTLF